MPQELTACLLFATLPPNFFNDILKASSQCVTPPTQPPPTPLPRAHLSQFVPTEVSVLVGGDVGGVEDGVVPVPQ